MRIDVISLFPQMFEALTAYGIPSRALKKGAFEMNLWNPRDFTTDNHRTVDDRPYGGGPGMVMMAEPLAKAIDHVKTIQTGLELASPVIYLSPQGKTLDQAKVQALAELPALTLLAGRYEGIDERLIQSRVDEELSIGDYVLAGGEFPAMVLIEAMSRLMPGVLGNVLSAQQDSFSESMLEGEQGAKLLDCPHYTRPEEFEGHGVPKVLLSGHHGMIDQWRHQQSLERTRSRRPDLITDQV